MLLAASLRPIVAPYLYSLNQHRLASSNPPKQDSGSKKRFSTCHTAQPTDQCTTALLMSTYRYIMVMID